MHTDDTNLSFTSKGIAYNMTYAKSMFRLVFVTTQHATSFPVNPCTLQLVHVLGKYRLTLFGWLRKFSRKTT